MNPSTPDIKPNQEESLIPIREFFKSDDLVPNSEHPVTIYKNAFNFENLSEETSKEIVSEKMSKNGWYLDWKYFVYPFLHYHSTAFECLVVYSGTSSIQLGGKKGKTFEVCSGDCIIIPAGVGHERIMKDGEDLESFVVFGSYPVGQTWDFISEDPNASEVGGLSIVDKEVRMKSEDNIRKLPTPTDPYSGELLG